MRVHRSDHFAVPLPPGHRFPMAKYVALRIALLGEGVLAPDQLVLAAPADPATVALAHDPAYVDAVLRGALDERAQRALGFPWSEALVARSLASVGGTLAAARDALRDGVAGNLAGGTHHASRDRGSGYCVFNDLAVTACALLAEGAVARVLVFDADVHQGDGTAAIFAGDARVFTCSVHGARNFPFTKPPSDLDVELPDATGDDAYLAAIARALDASLDRARPDLVLYQAGVDPLREDRLGRLSVSRDGLYRRDHLVLDAARRRGLPIALTLGGGYAEPLALSVAAHVGTYRAARAVFG
jgi:acetoin utilization deacetylase AcuC-like enzyme